MILIVVHIIVPTNQHFQCYNGFVVGYSWDVTGFEL